MPALYLATGKTAGEEISSTYEGRHITVEESYLAHAYHADGLVDKGDPCIIGENIVGVALNSATAATDLITLDTEGIWFLNVVGSVSDGTSDGIAKALVPGDVVYIEQTPGAGVNLSGESDPNRFKQFGYLLGNVSAHVTTATLVAVKVHGEGVPNNGVLNFGSGSTAGFNFPLEGDVALRNSVLIRATIEPATILLAGEQLHGFNIRIVDNAISTGGEITAGELKAVRDEATDATVSSATALKLNVDNKNGGVAPFLRALDIMIEGAPGTTPAKRSGIHFNSSGTAGTLEALIELEAFTVLGGVASDTLNTPSGTIAVNVAGVIHYIQLYST
ncbi:MAG: hypothetical protein PHU08_00200 [Dehalococcoidales bacterium]|nr:hypothetical protein [Dehalococcoidales bacterium]